MAFAGWVIAAASSGSDSEPGVGRSCSGRLGDTWEWDGQDGLERQPTVAPAPRSRHGLAFDAHRGRTVLFGGLGTDGVVRADTWHWLPTTRGTVTERGDGCAGQAGVPQLAATGAPIVGDGHFAMTVTNGAPGRLAIVVVSADGTVTPLPGGCALLAAAPWIEIAGTLDATGARTAPVPIPLDSGLSGATAFAQAFVADPSGAFLGVAALSPGLVVTIGD